MSLDKLFVEKELSWLSFNERVLQEAMDKTVPIVERVRFLGIFSNNLDEFFKVRVADVKRRIIINEARGGDEGAKHLLTKIQNKVLKLQQDFDNTYKDLILALARHNIFLVNENQLSENQQNWIRNYFKDKLLRHLAPIELTKSIDLVDFLKDEYTYLAIEIRKGDETKYSLVEVPTNDLPRFIQLPSEQTKRKKSLILLDNIIRFCIEDLFKGFYEFDSLSSYSIKMTRDAEYNMQGMVEHGLLEQMSEGLKQRLTNEPLRFVYDREMPLHMVDFIKDKLHISSHDSIIPGGRYHNFKDFIGFPNVGRAYLENPSLPALSCHQIEKFNTVFDAISERDILLYYPFHKFRYVTELIRQAALDPKVSTIKINLYRVAKKSRVVSSLIDAVNNGKKVTVVIELQARFDEAANIKWSKRLTQAGVKVVFGVPTLKIHSKLCLITRLEDDQWVKYAHLGTGNFNEKTAQIYTDFALLTKNQELAQEVDGVFDFIEHPYRRTKFNHLLVSPINCRRYLYRMIDAEIASAKQNKPAAITVKVNNLVDKGIVNRLYAASSAGVKIRMIIRGMCALVPGVTGISENIEVISIVDRFLEHPRAFIFHNNGDEKIYISSADWMTRNIDNRIEVGCPIYHPELRAMIKHSIELQFKDTTKARIIDKEQSNEYVQRGNRRKIRSQVSTYEYLKRREQQLVQKHQEELERQAAASEPEQPIIEAEPQSTSISSKSKQLEQA
ncbi:polyphosphate kinase 1 [Motilimonas cestriensis]|uniref:Polyphosphate kinase n=1 Tax=Motilimonas cestriensis TaxID=2742685 RepID=A0ABS8W7I4_9GAMM|nr:polyphosphate kinase 1 [Motilimonas cestriensis]